MGDPLGSHHAIWFWLGEYHFPIKNKAMDENERFREPRTIGLLGLKLLLLLLV